MLSELDAANVGRLFALSAARNRLLAELTTLHSVANSHHVAADKRLEWIINRIAALLCDSTITVDGKAIVLDTAPGRSALSAPLVLGYARSPTHEDVFQLTVTVEINRHTYAPGWYYWKKDGSIGTLLPYDTHDEAVLGHGNYMAVERFAPVSEAVDSVRAAISEPVMRLLIPPKMPTDLTQPLPTKKRAAKKAKPAAVTKMKATKRQR